MTSTPHQTQQAASCPERGEVELLEEANEANDSGEADEQEAATSPIAIQLAEGSGAFHRTPDNEAFRQRLTECVGEPVAQWRMAT